MDIASLEHLDHRDICWRASSASWQSQRTPSVHLRPSRDMSRITIERDHACKAGLAARAHVARSRVARRVRVGRSRLDQRRLAAISAQIAAYRASKRVWTGVYRRKRDHEETCAARIGMFWMPRYHTLHLCAPSCHAGIGLFAALIVADLMMVAITLPTAYRNEILPGEENSNGGGLRDLFCTCSDPDCRYLPLFMTTFCLCSFIPSLPGGG
jgi:hypothetical protein